MGLVDALVTALTQVLVFALVPFIWWFFTVRKKESFFWWLGLKSVRTSQPGRLMLAMLAAVALFSILSIIIVPALLSQKDLATSGFAGKGSSAMLLALVYAFIQTGLSEEIVFRGFLGKRFISKFGFPAGNIMQALLFGLTHGALFLAVVTPLGVGIITLFTGFIGWELGYLNEKLAGGSILPSWLLHGLSNFASALAAMYSIM